GALRCSHPGRVLLQGDDARGASLSRPMAACGLDVPGKSTPRGVAHLRYTCVVCALTSASGCAPPGGTSTSSSAGQQEDPPMEPTGALAVRTRGGCSYKVTTPGGRAYRALWRPVGSTFPGSGSPGCSAPALRLRCLRAYVGERVCPREGRAPARPRCSRRART